MAEVLRVILDNFWSWLGTYVLLTTIVAAINIKITWVPSRAKAKGDTPCQP